MMMKNTNTFREESAKAAENIRNSCNKHCKLTSENFLFSAWKVFRYSRIRKVYGMDVAKANRREKKRMLECGDDRNVEKIP